jgi:imidazolonepropionase-like amidohydrolase
MRMRWASVLAIATSCAAAVMYDDISGNPEATSIAIVNVNVVPMDLERVLDAQTVLVENGRIVGVGPSALLTPPAGWLRIEGKGRYLLPGLIDMHVHIRANDLESYLRAGVTSVRNMWGFNELVPIMRDVESGVRLGPRIFSLTSGFDGSPAVWPQTQISDDPAAIAALIDRQYAMGFREIKVYQKLSRESYDTIVSIARRKGMTFAGHMPLRVGLDHVLASGQRSIEHLGGYGTGEQLRAQVAATVRAGTYNCPTLAIQTMLNSSSIAESRRVIVAALHAGGARLLVGTDAGIDRTAPGVSIHDELELMVQSGLTPFAALLGATRTAAEYLGQTSTLGAVKVGMSADLIIVTTNPLKDIRATRNVERVIVRGRLIAPSS